MSTSVHTPGVILSFPTYSFRSIPTPLERSGIERHICVVPVAGITAVLANWMEVNARVPDPTRGRVPKAIRQTLAEAPEWFVLFNKGLALLAKSVTYDNQAKTTTVQLTDKSFHGLMDGGHTLAVILEHLRATVSGDNDTSRPEAFCTIEVLTGIPEDRETISDLVEARNTSKQVASSALDNLEGAFDGLKRALQPYGFDRLISWKENEDADVDVREVIALLTSLDKTHYVDDRHPLLAYTGKEACLKHFETSRECYERLYGVAADILKLSEVVQAVIPNQYNDHGGRFGRLKGCENLNQPRVLTFTGVQTEYPFPLGYLAPLVAAFRAFLVEQNGRYVWGKGIDPLATASAGLAERMFRGAVVQSISKVHNPNATGKDPNVWALCYQMAENHFLRLPGQNS